ncbi:hypothetical protein HYE67_004735 [Fusarium culmorum]|uniref:Uncharacterized protein n=1 Tax=Fusarium culmorum TaxID=5516 RepID=A0A2T4GZ58_FUSCU|nr:hypothetical protein FCULG_00010798 [Fusarium culmorum]QPC62504.1 hypothetical protein HYE67_004735 [Fusarium culmorum]
MNVFRRIAHSTQKWMKQPLYGTVNKPALPPFFTESRSHAATLEAQLQRAEAQVQELQKEAPDTPMTLNDALIKATYLRGTNSEEKNEQLLDEHGLEIARQKKLWEW